MYTMHFGFRGETGQTIESTFLTCFRRPYENNWRMQFNNQRGQVNYLMNNIITLEFVNANFVQNGQKNVLIIGTIHEHALRAYSSQLCCGESSIPVKENQVALCST